jgi:hypothetical protein
MNPRESTSLRSKMREDGSPDLVHVERVIASGSLTPACEASVNHWSNCVKGDDETEDGVRMHSEAYWLCDVTRRVLGLG